MLTMHFLGRAGETRFQKAAEYLRRQQLPSGGWTVYPGGPPEVSASTKAYFTLKLAGDDPEAPHMAKARRVIVELGGLDACNSFTKIYLSIFGQYDWEKCPTVPAELILLPDWMPFSIYRMSSWSRAIVVPLSIISAYRPSCPVPERASLSELQDRGGLATAEAAGEEPAHPALGSLLRRRGPVPPRAGIPPLDAAAPAGPEPGRGVDPRASREERRARGDLPADREHDLRAALPRLRGRPSDREEPGRRAAEPGDRGGRDASPPALLLSGLGHGARGGRPAGVGCLRGRSAPAARGKLAARPRGPRARRLAAADSEDAARRLVLRVRERVLSRHRRHRGGPGVSGGRAFSRRARGAAAPGSDRARRGLAARDAERRRRLARLRPRLRQRGPDVHPVRGPQRDDRSELRGHHGPHAARRSTRIGVGRGIKAVRQRRRVLERAGRTTKGPGTDAGAATSSTGRGSPCADSPAPARICRRSAINARAAGCAATRTTDGGWGELPHSYDEPGKQGIGPSTPSQTAWALLGLFALGDTASSSVRRGLEYLLRNQQYDGSWKDEYWTGTGFPRVFYLRYHLYATYFPLWALAVYEREAGPPDSRLEAADRRVLETTADSRTGEGESSR